MQPASGDPQLVAYDEADGTLAATADPPAAGAYQLVTLESQSVLLVLVRHDDGTVETSHVQIKADVFRPLPNFTGFVPDADLDALSADGAITAVAI